MMSRVRFPVLPWGFFLEGEDPHGDHSLGSLVEFRFNALPSTSYSYITIHNVTAPHGRPKLRSRLHFGHEVHKGHVMAFGGGKNAVASVSRMSAIRPTTVIVLSLGHR
jgi:hypothetical protein